MDKVLVPYDGSDNAMRALEYAVNLGRRLPGMQLEILNVQDPVFLRTAAATEAQIRQRQDEEGRQLCEPACQLLRQSGIPFDVSTRVGSPANQIAEHVREAGCTGVIMGTRGMGTIASLMIGSVALKVIHFAEVPVTLIK